MITEEERLKTKADVLKERKAWLRQIIEASARYERLLSDKDFQDVLKDLGKVSEAHKTQVDVFVKLLSQEDSPFRRMRLESVITKHQIRKDQIDEAILYPERLVFEASKAREELNILKQEEEDYAGHESNGSH